MEESYGIFQLREFETKKIPARSNYEQGEKWICL